MKKTFLITSLILSACGKAPETQTREAIETDIGAYMIVQGKNYDSKDLGPYAASLPPIYEKYGGRYVAFAPQFDIVEGTSDAQAIIISGWPDVKAAKAFWDSPEYAKAIKLREGIGEFDVVILPALTQK